MGPSSGPVFTRDEMGQSSDEACLKFEGNRPQLAKLLPPPPPPPTPHPPPPQKKRHTKQIREIKHRYQWSLSLSLYIYIYMYLLFVSPRPLCWSFFLGSLGALFRAEELPLCSGHAGARGVRRLPRFQTRDQKGSPTF